MTDPVIDIPAVPATEEPLPLASPVRPGRPDVHLTPRQWVRENLFATPFGSLLTVVFGLGLAYAAYRLAWFVAVSSDWEIVRRNLRLFMIQTYPDDDLWRLWVSLYLIAGLAGLFGGAAVAHAERRAIAEGRMTVRRGDAGSRLARLAHRLGWVRRYWPALLAVGVILSQTRTWTPTLLTLVAAVVLVATRWVGRRLPVLARFTWLALLLGVLAVVWLVAGPGGVSWDDWGGFQLTVFVTVAGIALSFPIGVLAALGRRSSLPAVRWITTGYIELIRGVPLVTLLFMGEFVIRLFFPNTVDPPGDLTRALIAITLFEAAYVAETVRGGLQSIPRGQFEAAQALGLSPWSTTRRIVLPQALQAVLPPTVGQFISLFKDTTLLQIIGFIELLEVAENASQQGDFLAQGLHTVSFGFVALIFWAGSYTMSRESRRIEDRLGLGGRNR